MSEINTILSKFVRINDKREFLKPPDNDQLNIFLARSLFKLIKSKLYENKLNLKKLIICDNKHKKFSEKFGIFSSNIENKIAELFQKGQGSLSQIVEKIGKPKTDLCKQDQTDGNYNYKSYNNEYLKAFYGPEKVRILFYYIVEYLELILEQIRIIETFNFKCCLNDVHDEACYDLWKKLLKYLSDNYLAAYSEEEKQKQKEIADKKSRELQKSDKDAKDHLDDKGYFDEKSQDFSDISFQSI